MIGTPGIFKFLWPKDNVQSKFSSIYDIPVMNIDKKVTHFDPKKDQNLIIIHTSDSKGDQQTVRAIQDKAKVNVYIIPDQNSPDTFEQIKKVYPNALGKMILNGKDAHPLAKFFRKSAFKLYDFQMFGASKVIPLSVFEKTGDRIVYYSGQALNKYIAQL